VVGGTRNQAIAKTALATSDAFNMDLSKTDPLRGHTVEQIQLSTLSCL
jgi:hypothetical protein